MDENAQKEEMSIAYLSAICAHAGIDCERIRHDDDSTDCIVKKIMPISGGGKFNAQVRVQLKATSSTNMYRECDDYILYSLKRKNYNDFQVKSSMPIILALLILPKDMNDWLAWTEKDLLLNCRMYWTKVEPIPGLQGNSTSDVRIKLLKSNPVNTTTLEQLLLEVAEDTF